MKWLGSNVQPLSQYDSQLAVEAPMVSSVAVLQGGKRKAREATHVHLVGNYIDGSTDGSVECKVHPRQMMRRSQPTVR